MARRTCTKCGIEKDEAEFSWKNKKDNKRDTRCKSCVKDYKSKWRKRNLEKARQQERENARRHRENNPEKYRDYYKKYMEENRDRISKQRKKWLEENKDHRKAYDKKYRNENKDYFVQYREENKDQIRDYHKKYREENKDRIVNENRKRNTTPCPASSKCFDGLYKYESVRASNDKFIEIKCVYCGKWFTPLEMQIRRRLQSINGTMAGENRLYCSEECKTLCPTFRRHFHYKSQEGENSREVSPELRQLVFERDNWTCQKCEQKGGSLQCHHINPVKKNPIESGDIDNCITLCIECHKGVHRLPKCTYGYLAWCEN